MSVSHTLPGAPPSGDGWCWLRKYGLSGFGLLRNGHVDGLLHDELGNSFLRDTVRIGLLEVLSVGGGAIRAIPNIASLQRHLPTLDLLKGTQEPRGRARFSAKALLTTLKRRLPCGGFATMPSRRHEYLLLRPAQQMRTGQKLHSV